ncbi:hypothetical protein [Solidesulfovibrio sp.]
MKTICLFLTLNLLCILFLAMCNCNAVLAEIEYDDIITANLAEGSYSVDSSDPKAIKVSFTVPEGVFWCYIYTKKEPNAVIQLFIKKDNVKFDMKIESSCRDGACIRGKDLFIGQITKFYEEVAHNSSSTSEYTPKNNYPRDSGLINVCGNIQNDRKSFENSSLTELQKKSLKESFSNHYVGKSIRWQMKVVNVKDIPPNMLHILTGEPDSGVEIKLISDCGSYVIATFDEKYKNQAIRLSKGDMVDFSGTISSVTGGLFYSDSTVLLRNCKILSIN